MNIEAGHSSKTVTLWNSLPQSCFFPRITTYSCSRLFFWENLVLMRIGALLSSFVSRIKIKYFQNCFQYKRKQAL